MDDNDIENLINGKEEDADLRLLKDHTSKLMEKFDTVMIFTTRHEPGTGGTVHAQWGSGNWYARYGQVREWLLREEKISEDRDSKNTD
jgi:hypothetical protein